MALNQVMQYSQQTQQKLPENLRKADEAVTLASMANVKAAADLDTASLSRRIEELDREWTYDRMANILCSSAGRTSGLALVIFSALLRSSMIVAATKFETCMHYSMTS